MIRETDMRREIDWRERERVRKGERGRLSLALGVPETLPCVFSKRPCHMRHGHFESTHGSVLKEHTGGFFIARRKETHTQPHPQTRPQQHAQPKHITHTSHIALRREMREIEAKVEIEMRRAEKEIEMRRGRDGDDERWT